MRYLACMLISYFVACQFVLAQDQNALDDSSKIEYSSVQEALTELTKKEGVEIRSNQGWTIISDTTANNRILWSFTPDNHSAFPAVVKRTVIFINGALYLNLAALCEADKNSCDKLVSDFEKMNERIRQDAARNPPQ